MPTPLQTIKAGEKYLNRCIESLSNKYFLKETLEKQDKKYAEEAGKSLIKATLQALWDEAEGRKQPFKVSENMELREAYNQAIQTYQDSLLKLIKAI